ncbi:MAG: hypothetical protein QM654_07255 [Dysgonamonadaceae bacterium]
MVTQRAEKEFYRSVYSFAMGKEAEFFYDNDVQTILCDLKTRFWGEDLIQRLHLLAKLLYFDSFVNTPFKEDLRSKSEQLKHLTKSIQE